MYTTRWCGYCDLARALLRERGLPFEEIGLDDEPDFRARLMDLTGRLDGAADPHRRPADRRLHGAPRSSTARGLLDGLAA